MSKQRSISSEQLLYILMNKREEENQKKGIIKKELKKDSCKKAELLNILLALDEHPEIVFETECSKSYN